VSENRYTIIDLLRHGDVQGGRCYRGVKDDPLSDLGWQQMLNATDNQTWDAIVSSPLQRCSAFAEHLSADFETVQNFKEINFGDWEGQTAEAIHQHSAEHLTHFMCDPAHNPPPNGEILTAFQNRIINEWNRLFTKHQFRHILLISHGGTMRTIISHILNMSTQDMMRLEIEHASMSRIRIYHENNESFPSLVFHGRPNERLS